MRSKMEERKALLEGRGAAEEVSKSPPALHTRPPALSPSAADIAAGSPHFSMDTPPESPVMESAKRTLWVDEEHSTEEGEKLPASDESEEQVQYEWQSDLMHHLPHEKAVSLVNLLKESQRGKAQATGVALQLQKKSVN